MGNYGGRGISGKFLKEFLEVFEELLATTWWMVLVEVVLTVLVLVAVTVTVTCVARVYLGSFDKNTNINYIIHNAKRCISLCKDMVA